MQGTCTPHWQLPICALAWGDPQEAVEETPKQVVAKNPTRVEGRVAYAEYLLRIGKSKEGLQVAQEAVAAIPDDPQLLDVLGRAQRAKGNT